MIYKKYTRNIGIDIDSKHKDIAEYFERRMLNFGQVTRSNSKHGYHYKILLLKPVTWKKAMRIRHVCGDDKERLIQDYERRLLGSHYTDILFDYKRMMKK